MDKKLYNDQAKNLILASSSETRKKLLTSAGLAFTSISPQVDEDTIKLSLASEGASPEDQALILAKLKAERISQQNPHDLVIGADQILEFKGKILNKPVSIAEAQDQLQNLRGHRHKLLTGLVVALAGVEIWRHIDTAVMTMRPFSDLFLQKYLHSLGNDVYSTVGGYHIEGIGIQLFSSISGDRTTIEGLTLLPLINFLREHDVVMP